ncbi:O-antigen ligase family protein [Actinoplanes sp. NPDC023714]|uniref:O-antigen ligase family protein n=1 Tax=Actinoplanes sp. NPDC023714 TaxID=3154322 RepID=UPI0033C8E49E
MSLSTAPQLADLEPSFVGSRTYATRRRFMRLDAGVLLSLMICLLTLIPASLILPGMTDVGRPALVVALLMWFWWIAAKLNPNLVMVGPNPIRFAVLAYVVAMLVSYAVGFLRGLSVMEANGADRALLMMLAFTGVILIMADGLPNWERLNGVLRVFVWCSAFMAVVAMFQAVLKLDVTQYLMVPGLQPKGYMPDFETRGAAIRVASTTGHYIEMSACMAVALPLAIHFARFSVEKWRRRLFLVAALLVAAAIPLTISRTGVVAAGIALAAMLPVWGWRMRYNIFAMGVGLMGVLMVAKPGLLGTIRDLFTGANEDTSIQARTDRYGMVGHYFAQRPWLGRGTGTWIPPQYQILDNQWLTLALNGGILGVAALAALHVTAITLTVMAWRRSGSEEQRHLCAALISAQLGALFVAAFFDSLSFSTYATVISLMIGACATVWRFTHPSHEVRTSRSRGLGD